jgi:hypothetical protein
MGIGIWQINEETFKKEIEIIRKYGFAGFVLFRDVYLVWPIPPVPPLLQLNYGIRIPMFLL